MSVKQQPAKKSYFFDKGYVDVINTIKRAWELNRESINKYKNNITNRNKDDKKKVIVTFILNLLAIISVIVIGTAITCAVSLINVIIVIIFMGIIYVAFHLYGL